MFSKICMSNIRFFKPIKRSKKGLKKAIGAVGPVAGYILEFTQNNDYKVARVDLIEFWFL